MVARRKRSSSDSPEFDSKPSRKVRRRRPSGIWRLIKFGSLFCLVIFILLLVFLPQIVTSPDVLNSAIDRYAGLKPLKLEIGSMKAGWFTPVSANEIELRDEDGNVLAKIGAVETEKSLLSWVTGYQDLGRIVVRRMETAVVAFEGTTNLEEALKPVIEQVTAAPEPDPSSAEAATLTGSIEVVDSRIVLADASHPARWLVAIPKLSAALPSENQIMGPIDLNLAISNAVEKSSPTGKIAANVQQAAGSEFEVRARMDQVPVDFWHVVHARLPEVPVEELSGQVSATLAGSIANAETWSFEVRQLEAQNFAMIAPELVGDSPAALQSISCSSKCSLSGDTFRLTDTKLNCDFASAYASATLPWPIVAPSIDAPFMTGAVIQANGTMDLPKLAQAAQSLIPLRKDTQLLSGTAQFSLGQKLNEQGNTQAGATLRLENLTANSAGQQLSWNDPLTIELAAEDAKGQLQFASVATAEFASLKASGSLESGQVDGQVDLSLLRQRLNQWVELPIAEMAGSAQVQTTWRLGADEVLYAEGNLSTTPIVLATNANKEMREDAWQGKFHGSLFLPAGVPSRFEEGKVELYSDSERLVFEIQDPIDLQPADSQALASASPPAPAAFSIDLHADLARCNRRSAAWLTEPPEVDVEGKLSLVANGMLDLEHIEVTSANWSGEPIQVVTPELSFSEPKIVGSFRGLVDSNDLTRMKIENLEMTSSSVSLVAKDQAGPEGTNSRIGRAKFLMNLGNLLNSTQAIATRENNDASGGYKIAGTCNGELAWQINSQAAGINMLVNGQNLNISFLNQSGLSPIWQEPEAAMKIAGTWQAETGAISIQEMVANAPWVNYQGTASYVSQDDGSQQAQIRGQAVYDAAQLTQRLIAYTGGQIQMAGQHAMPVEVDWISPASDDSATDSQQALSGLIATTRIGWEQAAVAGIGVGKADVPVTIKQGILHTAAEIPVSGGFLRWDADCDLTQDDLVIHQKPMKVLENVVITEQMCKGWLKYITPLLAEATRVDGRMSLDLTDARFLPADPQRQTAAGKLLIHSATVGPGPLSNQMISLTKQIEAIRKRDFTQMVSNTQQVWLNMPEQNINFRMVNGRVAHDNLNVTIGDATLYTQGDVGVDGTINMLASMPIPDDWADKNEWLGALRGQSLQFPIAGTFSQPQVNTQLLANLGQQSVQNVAGNLLQQQLNKGLDKLLGPGNPPQEGQPPEATPENAVRGLGEQLLNGQGLNIPGFFGGGR